jgi:hypothetical protein
VTEAFERLAKYFKEEKQVLYIRDVHDPYSESEWLWSAEYNGLNEALVGMPRWGEDETQIENLTFAVNQALYVLARRQHRGISSLFCDEVINRGLSAYYAEVVTGYECPLKTLIASDRFRRLHMARYWFRPYEAHYGRWKPQIIDLWVATVVGLEIAMLVNSDDEPHTFCLDYGLSWGGYGANSLLWVLSHPKRRRSARILAGKVNQPRWSFNNLVAKLPG